MILRGDNGEVTTRFGVVVDYVLIHLYDDQSDDPVLLKNAPGLYDAIKEWDAVDNAMCNGEPMGDKWDYFSDWLRNKGFELPSVTTGFLSDWPAEETAQDELNRRDAIGG